eukprot:TRINITY_DN4545_c0_g1_i2.p1 TRINITY_DN4545_c0_g1~~TRINITY_DN4545_c0_g1_i2.p1  ORF type:complete len:275 (-),score=37.09 TRINITY_DN4545_c0_g1_i2:75-899(-)
MLVGGYFEGDPRQQFFQGSCINTAVYLILYVNATSKITTVTQLEQYLSAHVNDGFKIGADSKFAKVATLVFGKWAEVEIYGSGVQLYAALKSDPETLAVIPDAVTNVPPWAVQLAGEMTVPTCAYMRTETVYSCGDEEVDTALGEECETTGVGCTSDCKCKAYYKPTPTPGSSCMLACGDGSLDDNEECDRTTGCGEDCICMRNYEAHNGVCDKHGSNYSVVGIVVGSVVGFVFILILVTVIVALVIVIHFVLRRKFIADGVKEMRFAMFRARR